MAFHERYPRSYRALKAAGFSASKALEIIIDASRGDRHALHFIRICKNFPAT